MKTSSQPTSIDDDCQTAKKRLRKDLKQLQSLTMQDGITASPIQESNLFEWQAFLTGPERSAYEGGFYELHLSIPCHYPIRAPKVRFQTEIFHPNIYQTGEICLDILQDQWSEVLSIEKILLSIRSLLNEPNPNSPANIEAAILYKDHRKEFDQRVRNDIDKQWSKMKEQITNLQTERLQEC